MRPTVPESIAGIRRILAEVVGPEVHDEFAKVNFERCLAALEEVERRAMDVVALLRADVRDLTAVLAGVDDAAARDVAGRDDLGEDPGASYDGLHARYLELRAAAAELLDRSREGGDGVAELRGYLRRAVNRGLGL